MSNYRKPKGFNIWEPNFLKANLLKEGGNIVHNRKLPDRISSGGISWQISLDILQQFVTIYYRMLGCNKNKKGWLKMRPIDRCQAHGEDCCVAVVVKIWP